MPTSRSKYFFIKIKDLYSRLKISKTSGFTLIELLIVTAIIGILSTIVLANYNSFGGRQQVRDAAENFKSDLRKYQNFAISGQKNPDQSGDCTGVLVSYDVTITSNDYRVVVNCVITSITIPPIDFPDGIVVDPGCGQIRFFPLNDGTEICGGVPSMTVTFRGDADYDVIVNSSGQIIFARP